MNELTNHTLRVQQLFVQYQSQLKAFALVLSPNFVQADDLMQETFLTITAKAHEFDLESNFLAWSRSILRFKVLEARRAAGVKTVDYLDSLVATCPDQWASEERLHKLTECIQNLAPKAREIILLRYQREHSPSQIAEMLSRTVNSINVALSKARLALRDCMDRQLQTGSSQ
ncbi:sigma-70 family RNA polymerase sigma factor [Blastopirellula sp. J2-11]|uniref:sigma-70 family RNA polymerase sigma factor n=1 Tax=Blastopirellula sp. J2-11 TaxID=2943192 RepID=UPI0021C861A2|nr:sigma-70 family RNA polymerase sigma factor [Blastopirellula sp. J2-11]UUO04675.1 sigma-70 family RNA polymerase sigma factor [Blastopirellula sp. J2-11]